MMLIARLSSRAEGVIHLLRRRYLSSSSSLSEQALRSRKSTGALANLPGIGTRREILESAVSRTKKISDRNALLNQVEETKKKGKISKTAIYKKRAKRNTVELRLVSTMFHGLSGSLARACGKMPALEDMHPYERELVALTLEGGAGEYVTKTAAIRRLVNRLRDLHTQHTNAITRAKTRLEKQERCGQALSELQTVFSDHGHRLDAYAALLKQLKQLHVINPRERTVVMVGAPNVGKSSLVRALSSGKPEVQNYSFTTRGVLRGRMYSLLHRSASGMSALWWQVTDTPGLLFKPDESKRNTVEELTILALTHLERAVILFVVDPAGHCGYDLAMQMALRAQIQAKFPQHRWMDVWSKADLLTASQRTKAKREAIAMVGASLEGSFDPLLCSVLGREETHSDGRGIEQNEGGGEGADGTGIKDLHIALDQILSSY